MEKVAESFWKIGKPQTDLLNLVVEAVRICKLPNWWHPASGGPDYIYQSLIGQRAWMYKTWDHKLKTLQQEIQKAIEQKDRAMALGGVMAFANIEETFRATKQAESLLQHAENVGHDLAARLCKVHLSAKAALSGDNNFLCMAAWMMAGGVSPVADKIDPVTAAECVELLDKAQERWQHPQPIPRWCCDGVHCAGDDPRFMGMFPAMWAVCRAFQFYGRVDPADEWLREFQCYDGLVIQKFSTRYSYNQWLDNHVLPRWEKCAITEAQARPVELWLQPLKLSPKSRAAIRGLLGLLWDFAMWAGHIPTQRNPMELVTVKGATKRTRQPRSLPVEEFHGFIEHLDEPFRTLAFLCACCGLRISEALGLKWSDVDWLSGRLRVERAIVRQRVDDVKTESSRKPMPVDATILEVLKAWKQTTRFGADGDWIFASPFKLGRLPWSYPWVWRVFQKAAADAGIPKLGTHSLRHSYRSWLDAVGTPLAVQQKLMRHSDIRTTMSYGDVVTDEMTVAASKITGLAFN